MFTFDGANKLIICDPGTVSFSAGEVYSRWKDWMTLEDNSKFEVAFANSVGGDPLGGGVSLGAYYFLTNGWRIRPQEADHELNITGNLFPIPDTASLFAPTVGTYRVQIGMRTSSLTQQVFTGGGGDPSAIAAAVWSKDLSPAQTANSAADVVKKAKNNAATAAALSA